MTSADFPSSSEGSKQLTDTVLKLTTSISKRKEKSQEEHGKEIDAVIGELGSIKNVNPEREQLLNSLKEHVVSYKKELSQTEKTETRIDDINAVSSKLVSLSKPPPTPRIGLLLGKPTHTLSRSTLGALISGAKESEHKDRMALQYRVTRNPPSAETMEAIKLKEDHLNYHEKIKEKGNIEDVQKLLAQRSNLSGTLKRHEGEKKTWIAAIKETEKLISSKKITKDDLDRIQKSLHKIGILGFLPDMRDKDKEIGTFLEWYNDAIDKCKKGQANPIVIAAQTYDYFLNVHPYFDGNGRMARLLMDLVLQKSGLPPFHLADPSSSFGSTNDLANLIRDGIMTWCKTLGSPSPFVLS